MVTVTVHLNQSEWDKVRAAARTWLGEQISNTELGRRLMILGCSALAGMPEARQKALGEHFRSQLDATPDGGGWNLRLQGQQQHYSQAAGRPERSR